MDQLHQHRNQLKVRYGIAAKNWCYFVHKPSVSGCDGDCSGSQALGTLRVENEHSALLHSGVGLSVGKVWGRVRRSKTAVGTQGYFNGLIKAVRGFFINWKACFAGCWGKQGQPLGQGTPWLFVAAMFRFLLCRGTAKTRGWVDIGVLSKWVGIPSQTQKSGRFPRMSPQGDKTLAPGYTRTLW